MPFLQLYASAFLVILLYMTVLWVASLVLKNASIIDIFWGLGFVLLAGMGLVLAGGLPARKMLIAMLVTVWGLRLSLYILSRNWGKPEDYRYRAWRKAAGASFWRLSYFKVFLLQGVLLTLVAAPILTAESSPMPDRLSVFDGFGTVVWLVGWFFESVGDWQLAHFRSDPANQGKVMRNGLWAYTRHPNYFGDAMVWWGIFIIALGTPGGFWTLFSPILMTLLLARVTGATVLERGLAKRKPDYAAYAESTSAFIPWFPHKRKGEQS
jgi:steroid 5-alpha reductase family enzyme